ncbi:MAG: hypothetical protein KJ015_23380 [Myxococcales bacterium]|nr:hypothetical protein [Sorangiineae bacterium PRO1]MCL4753122.1 hypothetical protein [Myxococcales bacterium]
MAKKSEPAVPLTDRLVSEVESMVRAERFVPTKQLVRGKLSRHDEALLFEKLALRGLERTPKGVRTPLAGQIASSIDATTPVPLAALAKRVRGATAAEVKRTLYELVRAGELSLLAGASTDEVTRPGSHVLAPAELDALRDLAKLLPKLVARARPRKGLPAKTLRRAEARAVLEPLISLSSSPAAPAGEVLETLAALERARGRSVFVPDLVRALGAAESPAGAHRALLALAHAGKVELRPESGVGNLSAADRALCPSDAQGTLISYARVLAGGRA